MKIGISILFKKVDIFHVFLVWEGWKWKFFNLSCIYCYLMYFLILNVTKIWMDWDICPGWDENVNLEKKSSFSWVKKWILSTFKKWILSTFSPKKMDIYNFFYMEISTFFFLRYRGCCTRIVLHFQFYFKIWLFWWFWWGLPKKTENVQWSKSFRWIGNFAKKVDIHEKKVDLDICSAGVTYILLHSNFRHIDENSQKYLK